MLGFLRNKKDSSVDYFQESKRLRRQIDNLERISHLLITGNPLDASLQEILNDIPSVLGVLLVAVLLWHEEEKNFRVVKLSIPKIIEKIVERALNSPVQNFVYPGDDPDNIFVKSLKEDRIVSITDINKSLTPLMSTTFANAINSIAQFQMKLLVSIPLIVNDEKLGVIALGWRNNQLDENDQIILKTFANHASIAIYNSELYSQIKNQISLLERQKKEIESLFDLTSHISLTLDPDRVLQTAVDTIHISGSLIGVAVALYDLQTRKIFVKAATESELGKRAQQLIGNFENYGIEVDNPAYKENLLVKVINSGEAVTTKNFSEIVSPPMPQALANGLEKLLGLTKTVVIPLKSKGFTNGIIMFYMKDVTDNSNVESMQLLNTYAFQISIALENAQLYKKSQEIQARLIEARRRERDMIDVMGHELRTPISIVRNALLTLEMDYKKDSRIDDQPKLGKYLDMAIESTKREIRLIETLLSATKVEGNKMQLLMTKIDMLDVINDAIEGQKNLAADKNLTVKFVPPEGKEFFSYADRVRTQEIMDNFLSNAVKYTAQGDVEIYIWEEKDYVFIETKDSGIGISADDLQNLGKKFFRAKELFEGQPGIVQPSGTGLGLFVTFNLIDIMNGKRIIESERGKGSRFVFALPKYNGQPDQQIGQALTKSQNIGPESEEKPTDQTVEPATGTTDATQGDPSQQPIVPEPTPAKPATLVEAQKLATPPAP